MAASSSTAGSASTSVTGNVNSKSYHVFINHRGIDVKKTFARSLYLRLLENGLTAFLDQDELQQGYNFPSQIEHAVRTASVHVAVFSPRYAESYWCLNELLLMLESNAPIIPVFYRVTPAEVRWTQEGKDGQYARALQELAKKKTYDRQTHGKKLRYDSSTIENWRNALSTVADNSGFELEVRNGDELELELLDKLVERLLKMVEKPDLHKPDLHVAKYPTGLDEKLRDFEETVLLQQQESGKPQIVGIVGLGGVGKTTLAKEFYNRKKSGYHNSCFLHDVRDNASKGSLNSLQRKLFNSLTGLNQSVDSVDEGKQMLIKPLKSSNVLIILDDVDNANQVDALLPLQTPYLRSSCLILITSRDKNVLITSRVEKSLIYRLTGLNRQHSHELFCSHAFSQPYPIPGFESLVYKFLDSCNGLPLSLKVVGAGLYGRDISDWKDELESLQQNPPEEIQETLKITYDALNKEEKQMFLDIVCFFIGQKRDTAIRIWNGSGWNGRRGFQNLESKSLVEVDSLNGIHMHDHLRDMGRKIAEDSKSPRRLWSWTDNVIDDLLDRASGLTVRGVKMVLSGSHADDVYNAIVMKPELKMRRLQLLDTEDYLLDRILGMVEFPNLIWLRWNECPSSSLPSSIPMKNLRVLQVSGSQLKTLWHDESQAPLQLREMEIFAPLLNIPKSIGQLKDLEQIVIDSDSNMQMTKLPAEFCNLQSLKTLVLRNCSEIMALPDSFGDLSNLQHIDLHGCKKLERVPNSFANLTKLIYLNFNGCNRLTIWRKTLGKINTLEYIDLSDCEKIEILPPQVAHQRSLKTLKLKGADLKELPSAIGQLGYLEILELGSPMLDRLPATMGDLRNLKKLSIWDCRELKCLPTSLGDLRNLEEFSIQGCEELECLPPTMGDLRNLKKLSIGDSKELKWLPPSLGDLRNLKEMLISSCKELKCLPASLGDLRNLEEFTIQGCEELKCLPRTMGDLRNLKKLSIWDCKGLKSLPPSLGELRNLQELSIKDCTELKCLPPTMGDLRNLEVLLISYCKELKCLPASVGRMTQLTKLAVYNCPLSELPFAKVIEEEGETLPTLPRLRELSLENTNISEVPFAEGVCPNLEILHILECNDLVKVGTLPNTLKELEFILSSNLKKIKGLWGLAKLERLVIDGCEKVETVPSMKTFVSLQKLWISKCLKQKSIRGLAKLRNLISLYVFDCNELEELEGVEHCMLLRELYILNCPKVQWGEGILEQVLQQVKDCRIAISILVGHSDHKDSQCLYNLLNGNALKKLSVNVIQAMELPAECGKNVTASRCSKTTTGSSSIGKTRTSTPPLSSASSTTTTKSNSNAAVSVSENDAGGYSRLVCGSGSRFRIKEANGY